MLRIKRIKRDYLGMSPVLSIIHLPVLFHAPDESSRIIGAKEEGNRGQKSNTDDRVEKYRPVHLDDVVSHQDITATSKLLGPF